MADYAAYDGQETSLEGEHAWWRNISQIPGTTYDIVHAAIAEYVDAWRALHWTVKKDVTMGGECVDLLVNPPHGVKPTPAVSHTIAGAVNQLRVKAGWGGSG
jgi:hypothetical protein